MILFIKQRKLTCLKEFFFLLSVTVREINNKRYTLLQPNTLPRHRYWFANEVMNMVDEQSKINDIKLIEGRVLPASKDEILETNGKG